MGFKSLDTFNEQKFKDFFVLRDDNDSAQVIFLYRDRRDALVGNVHYIKSADYSGYVHCCGDGCPACAKGIRIQDKILIPLYNITENKIQYWDRNISFEPQLERDIFKNYPNPSEFVFTVTRHGAARSMDTTYEILATARNASFPYDAILAQFGITLPEGYEAVCKTVSATELYRMINIQNNTASMPTAEFNYQAVPRSGYAPAPNVPNVPVPDVEMPLPPLNGMNVQSTMDVTASNVPVVPSMPDAQIPPLNGEMSEDSDSDTETDLEDPDF